METNGYARWSHMGVWKVSRHFGPRTLWTQDISALVPNCPDIPALAPGGYSIHYTNTDPNLFPGANPG